MKNSHPIFALFLILIFLRIPCVAQEYLTDMRHYDVKDGLSHGQILDIYKDQRGIMWVMAKDKMNRFDGKSFTAIPNAMQFHSTAEIIGEDKDNDLWINNAFTAHEVAFFNTKSEKTISFSEKFANTPLLQYANTRFYYLSPSGDWFFGTESGELIRYNPENQSIVSTSFENKSLVQPFFEDEDGVLWLKRGKTLRALDKADLVGVNREGKVLEAIVLEDLILSPGGIDQQRFFFQNVQELCIVDQARNIKRHSLEQFSHQVPLDEYQAQYYFIKYDPVLQQYWWVSSENITVFQPEKGLLFDFLANYTELQVSNIHDVFIDEKGVVWLATINGLYVLKCQPNKFQQHLYDHSDTANQSDFLSCRGICTDQEDRLYINANSIAYCQKDGILVEVGSCYLLPLLANTLDRNGQHWVGAADTLQQYDGRELVKKWAVPKGGVWAVEEGAEKLWVGLKNGENFDTSLVWLDVDLGTIGAFNQYNEFEALKKGVVYSIKKAKDGTLWLVTTNGLYVLDEKEGILARYWTGGKGKYHLPYDDLRHMHEDEAGIIWLASSQGLLRLDREKEVSRQFTDEDGLSNNNIYAVYEDDFGFLWMSSDYGIMQFQKSTGKVKIYLPSDGLTHHEFNRISHHQVTLSKDPEKKGMIYFGSLNGVTAFHPRDFTANFGEQPDIPLVLLECKLFSGKTKTQESIKSDLIANKGILIRPGDQSLSIEFALLDYVNPELVNYEYRIKGYNDNWSSSKDQTLLVSGLPYGNFELVIRAKTGNGLYSKQALSIPIEVLRPYYLQWWFGLIMLALLLSMIYTGYRWRMTQLLQQKLLLEKEVQERTSTIAKQSEELRNLDKVKSRFFANVSHELRTPLTLILAPLRTVLKREAVEKDDSQLLSIAYQNAQNLLKLTNEILDLTKLEAGKLELNETPIHFLPEVRRIFSSFEAQAYQQGIDFQILNRVNPQLRIQLDKEKFEKILNNLLSNALKFTSKDGSITLHLEELSDHIRLKVADTGQGISAVDLPHVFERFYQSKEKKALQEGGTGIGLALCREFSKLFRAKLWVESEWGIGSTFFFEFPKKEIRIIPTLSGAEPENTDAIPQLVEAFKTGVLENEVLDGDPATLLLVEDNADLSAFLQVILGKRYQILTAENGQIALDILASSFDKNQQSPIKLILSDVMMPVMDGFQLLEKLKSVASYAAIPVVMLTARAELQDKLKALRIGVDDYMLKPFEEEELLVRIHNLLKNAALRKVYQQEAVELEPKEDTEAILPVEDASPLPEVDQEWLDQIEQIVKVALPDSVFNAEGLARQIFLSRRQLDRRLKVLTGLTAGEYIREVRMQQARTYFENRAFNSVKLVAYHVGVKSVAHFSKQYKLRFGKSPSSFY